MASFWHVTPAFKNTLAAEVFSSLETTFGARGESITASPINRVIKLQAAGRAFYVKTYTAGGKKLKRWFGRSRVQAEWENLLFFERLGIPVPPVVAYGRNTRWGMFQKGALVTAAVPHSRDLASLHADNHPLLADRQWVSAVSRQVARHTRRLHRERFNHVDLKWRNILVTTTGTPCVFFIDCPAGRIRPGPAAARGFIKDLACLDKVAKIRLSRAQRLRFYLDYRELERLDPVDKRRIRRILDFFKGRE